MMWKKIKSKNTLISFLVYFLFLFMLLIFGPAEIFFANASEFQFVYSEFAGLLAACAVLGSLGAAIVTALLPGKLRTILLSLVFGASVAGYFQVMLWNKGLDMLGLNPEGYRVQTGRAPWNLLFWVAILAAVSVLAIWKKEIWKKLVLYGSAFLLSIQLVALVSLMLTADEGAYRHVTDSWRLSGRDQFVVSADKNIIVLILDYFGNEQIDPMLEVYPGSTDFLHDFTFYTNADSVYYGTYPSLPHMLTGCELDMSKRVDEWLADIWHNERTEAFYRDLKSQDYVVNLYTPDLNILCGTQDPALLNEYFSNMTNEADEIDVFYKLLLKTVTKMSGYRMFPEYLKPYFYTDMREYADIIEYEESQVFYANYDYYDGLTSKRLSTDKSANYLIVQHLVGTHDYHTDAAAHLTMDPDTTNEETAKGCMVLVEEYLNQLKALGVYDDATILITADHSHTDWAQVIFYLKEAGETHDVSPRNNAPITHREFLPTLAEYAGLDPALYGTGETIHDYTEDSVRERTYWIRDTDWTRPFVPCYTGERDGYSNIYVGYTYTGDFEAVGQIDWENPDIIVDMVDAFF